MTEQDKVTKPAKLMHPQEMSVSVSDLQCNLCVNLNIGIKVVIIDKLKLSGGFKQYGNGCCRFFF